MLSLVGNVPKVLNLKEILLYYLSHQEEVVTRRTKYDLEKALARANILEGLFIALDNIDEVIRIIRASENVNIAKEELMKTFALNDLQAQAIVDMRLRALTGLERGRLEAEYEELTKKIEFFRSILADEKKLLEVIKEEISILAQKYGDERKTGFEIDSDIGIEDLIDNEDVVIAMTKLGYIKRMSPDNFKAQNRGGKGIKGMQTIEDDFIEDIVMTTTHKEISFFTNKGRVYKIKAYRIPEASRTARGTAIVNLLELQPEEKVTAIIPIEKIDNKYLFMATKAGLVKRVEITAFDNIRKSGLTAIKLNENDELIEVKPTNGNDDIIMVSSAGKLIRFIENEIRVLGRNSMGVRGMRGLGNDSIIGVQTVKQGHYLLTVTENGLGKRSDINSFSNQHRGGKGITCHKITEKTGELVGAKLVDDGRELLLIASDGMIIRIEVDKISVQGRHTSGVKLMNIDREDVKVAGIAKVRESDKSEETENESIEENAD